MANKGKGFTLIELIVVVVLISILSALGIGLFSAPKQYSPALALQQWLNQIQFAQRQALLKQDLTQIFLLTINNSSGDWQFELSQGATTLDRFIIEHESQKVYFSFSDFSSSCSSLSELTFPLILYFNGMGNHVSNTGVVLNQNLRLCFSDSYNMCFGPSGLAYGGDCVP